MLFELHHFHSSEMFNYYYKSLGLVITDKQTYLHPVRCDIPIFRVLPPDQWGDHWCPSAHWVLYWWIQVCHLWLQAQFIQPATITALLQTGLRM
jgi:hypothetical protein